MEEIIPAPGAPGAWSDAQLHGVACIVCGSSMNGLMSVGHVYTQGTEPKSRLGWPVVACPQHTEAGEALCAASETGAAA